MKHTLTIVMWSFALVVGAALFWTSNQVQHEEAVGRELLAQISAHEERIEILTAEWHYLNNPQYLDKMLVTIFQTEDHKSAPLVLADTEQIPALEVKVFPVKKPVVPESFQEEQPILVVEHENGHPVEVEKKTRDIGLILASWTQ
jgi:hypothetical protein